MNKILKIYHILMRLYGCQGWWPISRLNNCTSINITKSGSLKGYHPKDYTLPKERDDVFEIIVGAILTQNTSWLSVEKALVNLQKLNALNPERMMKLPLDKLKAAIRPAGYYNQKARYIKEVTKFFISLNGRVPTRAEVLAVHGVGNETADSIMLYAFKQPEFVVDAYTKRIFTHLRLIKEKATYMEIKKIFEKNLPKELEILQEYHALIVEHAKRYYSKMPYGVNDPLAKLVLQDDLS